MLKPLILLLPLLILPCCGKEKKVTQAPSVETGSILWKTSCASCHGADANGLPDLSPTLVGSEFVSNSTDKELLEYITVGRKVDDPKSVMNLEMPPKGGNPMLKENDLLSIVAYIRTLQ
ncbi:MAG: cytochrome c [Phycisphaerales bacterium]|jgi:mono/diheme cytochrome c family protein|nr:cytochrome c [Phycisphaerales bacterium]